MEYERKPRKPKPKPVSEYRVNRFNLDIILDNASLGSVSDLVIGGDDEFVKRYRTN